MRCPTCGRPVDRCPTCGQPTDDETLARIAAAALVLAVLGLSWLIFAIGHPRAALHELASFAPLGVFALVPLAILVLVWWGGRVYARPGDEPRRPERRAESVEGSE